MKGWTKNPWLVSACGAVLAVLCGLLLWLTPLGDPWTNASYDYLFRFGSRAVTNQVTLILMDNGSFDRFHQTRGQPWDRALHTQLLNRLADDGCSLVAFDSFFKQPRDPEIDAALAAAMRRQKNVVLMAEQTELALPTVAGAEPVLPAELFLNAAGTNNWGVAWFSPDLDHIVRQQWPFPSPGPYPSLPWTAAKLAGAKLSAEPQERWLRYYGQDGAWTSLSYQFALAQPTNYFRNRIVFIGTQPKTSLTDGDTDKFSTPYTRWTDEASGGVEILLTAFLNLLNNDSLERPDGWIELLLFAASGILLGGGLCRLRIIPALVCAAGVALVVSLVSISLSFYTSFWFPWLIIAGAQVPCAMAWALAVQIRRAPESSTKTAVMEPLPATPGYELVQPAFGEGAYGKVWLAKNSAGQWRALKVVYLAKFGDNAEPYDREYNGVQKYRPISDQHPGLLYVDFVSDKLDGYFYYTMELGDALAPGWEKNPSTYKPRDLSRERNRLPGQRLPLKECLRIGLTLSRALEFLHNLGMTHRDIKPQNIIFINGEPKLADLGLITFIRPDGQERTLVGTPGFMPPHPERPGTPQADIYALGMVLYVLSTGHNAMLFPEVSTTLVSGRDPVNFIPLNAVILKACQPDLNLRYASAVELTNALLKVAQQFDGKPE